jgi:outer membrane protein assembly factor BamB
MRKDILSAAALLLAITALLVALPAASSSSSTSKTQTQAETTYHTLALVDAKTGKIDSYLPDPDSQEPTSVVSDKKGGWYVSGSFTHIGEMTRNGLAHLSRDGVVDPAFVPDLPGEVDPGNIFLHGRVLFLADISKGVFALDARSGKRLWHTSVRGDDPVFGLAFGNGVLYVGGAFGRIGGVARSGIAALDPTTGKPTPWRVRLTSDFGPVVTSVVVANGLVYFGGDFSTVNGLKRELDLAAVSPRTGRPATWAPREKDITWNTNDEGFYEVHDILVSHNQVLVGSSHGGFAAFDARSARGLPWSARIVGYAFPLALSGDTAYLGGNTDHGFTRAGGKSANNLVSVVLPEGRFTSWRPDLGRCTDVYAMVAYGGKVLVAGYFSEKGCSS